MVTNVQPPILLNPKPLSGIAAFREKKTILGRITKVLTSPKTTLVLGGTLASLVTAGAVAPALTSSAIRAAPAVAGRTALKTAKALTPTTPLGVLKAGILIPAAAGALTVPAVRRIVSKTLSPKEQFKRGQTIGGIIEDPSKLLPKDVTPKGVGERVKSVAKTAGLISGAAAAAVGGVVLAKKGIEKVKSIIPSKAPTEPIAIMPSITPISSLTQPLGAVEKPTDLEKTMPPIQTTPPAIKITNKPEININLRKSKKFINQQNLIRIVK